jgi:hypothetical protein
MIVIGSELKCGVMNEENNLRIVGCPQLYLNREMEF